MVWYGIWYMVLWYVTMTIRTRLIKKSQEHNFVYDLLLLSPLVKRKVVNARGRSLVKVFTTFLHLQLSALTSQVSHAKCGKSMDLFHSARCFPLLWCNIDRAPRHETRDVWSWREGGGDTQWCNDQTLTTLCLVSHPLCRQILTSE